MNFIIGILTVFLVINSVLLILLVLVQLPKKDAGAGMAFGGGTADALFGAGSGNVLTKITKWAAGILLVLCLGLGYLHDKANSENSSADFARQLQQKQMQSTTLAPAPQTAPPPASAANQLLTPSVVSNTPAAK